MNNLGVEETLVKVNHFLVLVGVGSQDCMCKRSRAGVRLLLRPDDHVGFDWLFVWKCLIAARL